ncbi:MAG: hypothetical protein EA353_06015 [Puniceicoccaceae bacterium]|nr:MAG: hypothetical protein EA353_06015 [Puniceicoccaceae bacterium]
MRPTGSTMKRLPSHPARTQPGGTNMKRYLCTPLRMITLTLGLALLLGTSGHAGEVMHFELAGEPLIQYQAAPLENARGGKRFSGSNFIHPLKTPSGFSVTHSQPLDHWHHFGLWWPWKYVKQGERQVLFWELQRQQGIIEATGAVRTADGFTAESVYIDRNADGGPQEWIREEVHATISDLVDAPAHGYHLDLAITQHVLGDAPLEIVRYRYSGFTLRGAQKWNRGNSSVLTSEGLDYAHSQGTRARWILVQGANDSGGTSGILMMSHPKNQNHPEHLRTWDPSTLNGAIFVNFNPVQEASFMIEPDTPHTRKYRVFVFDGDLSAHCAESLWDDYLSVASL